MGPKQAKMGLNLETFPSPVTVHTPVGYSQVSQ